MCEHPLNSMPLTVKLYKTISNTSISPLSPCEHRLLPRETLHLGLRNITSYDVKHQHLRCLTIAQLARRGVLRCYGVTVLEKGIPIAKFYFIFIYIIIYINISITLDFRTIVFGTVTLQHCNTLCAILPFLGKKRIKSFVLLSTFCIFALNLESCQLCYSRKQ